MYDSSCFKTANFQDKIHNYDGYVSFPLKSGFRFRRAISHTPVQTNPQSLTLHVRAYNYEVTYNYIRPKKKIVILPSSGKFEILGRSVGFFLNFIYFLLYRS